MKKLFLLLVLLLTGFLFGCIPPVFAQSTTGCAIIDIGTITGPTPTIPPECNTIGNISGDAKSLAQQILANKNINLGDAAKRDIQSVIDGKLINNSSTCGHSVTIDPALLKLFLQLAQNYKYSVWNIASDHGCDQWQHPKGRATDIGRDSISGPGGWPGFRKAAYDVLPAGSHLLMSDCPGSGGFFRYRPEVREGHDASNKCDHQHIDLPGDFYTGG